MSHALKVGVKATNALAILTPTTGDILATVEIEPANICVSLVLPNCTNRPTKDQCKP